MNFDYVSERFVLLGIVSGSAEEECGTKYFPNVYSRLNSVSLLEGAIWTLPLPAKKILASPLSKCQ